MHPGILIRESVIPSGMTVTEAAARLGVGRPALSSLLNGKSSLSADMAVRLQKAFGTDPQQLLDCQNEFDRLKRSGHQRSMAVRAYVPEFLSITAREIADWANNSSARERFPVLIRKLVHSTGLGLRRVDFPGYGNAQRHGWDGRVETKAATPWIPLGVSCWELSTAQQQVRKADYDYEARTKSVPAEERAECAFVFVALRNWPGKTDWERSKQAQGNWREVRAFDASDLEQWLEQSIPGQIWLAEQINQSIQGVETLDNFWSRWSGASEPNITPEIFGPSIFAYVEKFKDWLEAPCERPFVVAADSKDEALAFLACLLRHKKTASRARHLATVFESRDMLRRLAESNAPVIPIVRTEEAERELAALHRQYHCIIARPRNAIDAKPDISVDLLDHTAFRKALGHMRIDDETAEKLDRESGRSPTILRRRLATIGAIRKPEWARDISIARNLIPIALTGAWHAESSADREVLELLSDQNYQEIEQCFASMLDLDDCPVWSAGKYRGVMSKVDALFAIQLQLTEKKINDFFVLADHVLSEKDRALELPEDQRWAAGLYGKLRNHSTALREGICETLVVLSVHGNNLFQDRLGIDVQNRVSSLILKLLTPLTIEKLLSHENDLPNYAEAAPDTFLELLEEDVQQPHPVVIGLLRPVDGGMFARCLRTGLLWALECLGWKNLARVSLVLAELSRTAINDNWANKPISSLGAFYRSWVPQTAASLEERISGLAMLVQRYPDIGWRICMSQIRIFSDTATPSYRPKWRSDASGAGHGVELSERMAFERKALSTAFAWEQHDDQMLGDLVERIQSPVMTAQDEARVWNLIGEWADVQDDERSKARLSERIRRFAFTPRSRLRELQTTTLKRAEWACGKLQSQNPVIRHAWLFARHWVQLPVSDDADDKLSYSEQEEKIRLLRADAMKEIWRSHELKGVISLLSNGAQADVVGHSLEPNFVTTNARADFLDACLCVTSEAETAISGCIRGFLHSIDEDALDTVFRSVKGRFGPNRIVRLFEAAPFGQRTWRLLDGHGAEIRSRYWKQVHPSWSGHSDEELVELIDCLLEAERPRAAFHAVQHQLPRVETSRLKRLLVAAATVNVEPAGHYLIDPYRVSEALQTLDGRSGINPDEMAQLEFQYLEALDHSEHGIPNLEERLTESPAVFVQMLAFAYKRSDNGQDPPEFRATDSKQRERLAQVAGSLFMKVSRLPGSGENGEVDQQRLSDWTIEVRRLCSACARAEIGDLKIGELLARASIARLSDEVRSDMRPSTASKLRMDSLERLSASNDELWPCQPVCEVMEKIASKSIGRGFAIGVFNARGVYTQTGAGGSQEREIAAQYRSLAERIAFDYPYVSSVINGIADKYDADARWEDNRARVEARLGYGMMD